MKVTALLAFTALLFSASGNAADQSYKNIPLPDLKADIGTLVGKKVETTGKLQTVGNLDMVLLKTDEFDMAPIMVDGNRLPREDRKKLLNGCQMILCVATIVGTVKKTPYLGLQIIAETVTWR